MYKAKGLIKDLPPKLREIAVDRIIEATTCAGASCKDRTEALEFTINGFEWEKTPERHGWWSNIYNEGIIPPEYLKIEYEIY